MKKVIYIFLTLLLIGVIGLGKYLIDRAQIFTGFAAKDVASCMFISERTQASIEAVDINFFPVNFTSLTVDTIAKTVTGTFFGFKKQTAVYRQGLGCALVADGNIEEVRSMVTLLPAYPSYPETVYWPVGDKLREGVPSHVDQAKLDKAIADALKEGNTRGIVIAYDTLYMAEAYNEGFDKTTPLLGWSIGKSVTSAMLGVLVKEGKININDPAPITEWANDERKNITIKSLLQMTSGLEWVEDYGDISDATIMLYEKGDVAKYAIGKKAVSPSDSVWLYSSGSSNILSEIIKRTIGNHQQYLNFPREMLFNRVGMRSAIMETDASGTFVASSYIFANTRDWARFGLLYLNNGIWNNDTLFPSDWVDFTRQEAPNSNGKYGAQFWLNHSGHEIPDAPAEVYFADGYHGQRIYIVPSKRLVIVRMGDSVEGDFDYNKFIVSVLDAFE